MSTHDSMRLRSPEEDLGLTAGEIRAFQNMSEDPTVGAYPVDPPTCSTTRRLLDGQHVIPGIGARGLLVCEQIKKKRMMHVKGNGRRYSPVAQSS